MLLKCTLGSIGERVTGCCMRVDMGNEDPHQRKWIKIEKFKISYINCIERYDNNFRQCWFCLLVSVGIHLLFIGKCRRYIFCQKLFKTIIAKKNFAKLFYQYTYSIILYQLFEMFYNVWYFKDLFEVATCTI